MVDHDTTRQNGGSGLEGRDSGSEKRSVRGGIAGGKDYARDKLTNGSKALPDTDGRLPIARRFRRISNAGLADQGGAATLFEARPPFILPFSSACGFRRGIQRRPGCRR